MSARIRRLALLGLVGLAFSLRVGGLCVQSLWRDEVDALRFATGSGRDLLEMFSAPGQNGPLYFLLLRPWLALAGQSEFSLRFFSVALGVLAVPLIDLLARRLFPRSRSVGPAAALLAATSPYLVWYSQEGKMYTAVIVVVLLSIDRFLAALRYGGWHRWLGYTLITGALFYLHLTAVLIVPAQAVMFLALRARCRVGAWKGFGASLAVLLLPYLPLLVWQLPLVFQPGSTGFDFVPLPEMAALLLTSYGLGVAGGMAWWMLSPVVLLAILGLAQSRDSRIVVWGVLGSWMLIPVIGLFLMTLSRPMFTARYLILILPGFLLLVAVGLVAIGRRSRALAGLILGALLLVEGRGLWLQAQTPLKSDFRAATRHVADRLEAEDLVLFLIPHGRYSFEYYWPSPRPLAVAPVMAAAHRAFLPIVSSGGREPYRWADGLYTNGGMDPVEAARRMSDIVGESRVVWLVATEVPMWDARGLVQRWLTGRGTLTDQAQYVRVAVYRYELH